MKITEDIIDNDIFEMKMKFKSEILKDLEINLKKLLESFPFKVKDSEYYFVTDVMWLSFKINDKKYIKDKNLFKEYEIDMYDISKKKILITDINDDEFYLKNKYSKELLNSKKSIEKLIEISPSTFDDIEKKI